MKKLILLVCISLPTYAQNTITSHNKAITVLNNLSEKLNSITVCSYDIKRELNYASENYHNVSEWSCFLNFDSAIGTIGFKYQINSTKSDSFFNGTEKFELNKETKKVKINAEPKNEDFKSLSAFYNSIVTLRNILPQIIREPNLIESITDTIIRNHPYQLVNINVGKRRIQNLGGGFDIMQTKYNFIYQITVDVVNNMLVEILQKNDLNDDFIRTTFSNINLEPNLPTEESWYYSTYLEEYKQELKQELSPLIPEGSIMLDWTLPLYNNNESLTLSQFKGKVILLDFWFKNCRPCIESVPHLNSLNEKFKNKNFEILGINTWDSKIDIAWFSNKYKLAYKVLMNGKELAEKNGIYAFPTLILLDKDGRVLYSGGFDQSKIENLIEKAL